MPAFLPLLGGISKALGAGAFARAALGGLSSMAKATKPVDVLSLGRQLGTPVPSAAQIKSAELARVGSAATGAAAALLGIPGAVASTISAFEGFGATILSRREQFAQFNAGIGEAFAKMRRQDTMLAIRGGANVSGSTTALADSFMALREDTQPMKEAMMNLWNIAGLTLVNLARVATKILDAVGFLSLLESINTWLNTMFGSEGHGEGIQTNLKEQLRVMKDLNRKVKEPQGPITQEPVEQPFFAWPLQGARRRP